MPKRFILCPDSFKGTLTAQQICDIQQDSIKAIIPDAEVTAIPMSDGGEGMVSAYHKILGGELVHCKVTGPLKEEVDAAYLMLKDGTAVLEMSAAAGLPMVYGRENPLRTQTIGVGEMIKDAEKRGAKKILMGIGGSCTNDCAIGMVWALGWRFLDKDGNEVEPYAENLIKIESIRKPEKPFALPLRIACDVNNPLLGERGATHTFGPQKGAGPKMIEQLETGMAHFAKVLADYSGIENIAELPGSGAAGGMGAASAVFLGGKLLPGAELLLETAGFDEKLKQTDYVITGEGRIDWQSADGKVIGTISKHCKAAGVPCIALCGSIGKKAEALYDSGVTAIFSSVPCAASFDVIKAHAAEYLKQLTDAVIRLIGK